MSDKHYKQCDCGAQVPCGTEKCEVCETITRLSSENAALRERVSVLAEMVDANSAEVRGILTLGETVKGGAVRLFKESAALRADLARVTGERDALKKKSKEDALQYLATEGQAWENHERAESLGADLASAKAEAAELRAERDVWKANATSEQRVREEACVQRDRLRAHLTRVEAERDAAVHKEGVIDTARARGFRACTAGQPLEDCKKEDGEDAQIAWATGWMDRAWQMRCERAEKARDAALAEVGRLREALEFYADDTNYSDSGRHYEHGQLVEVTGCSVAEDEGKRARAALTPPAPQQEKPRED